VSAIVPSGVVPQTIGVTSERARRRRGPQWRPARSNGPIASSTCLAPRTSRSSVRSHVGSTTVVGLLMATRAHHCLRPQRSPVRDANARLPAIEDGRCRDIRRLSRTLRRSTLVQAPDCRLRRRAGPEQFGTPGCESTSWKKSLRVWSTAAEPPGGSMSGWGGRPRRFSLRVAPAVRGR
jgi:hypothetical protein